MRASLRLVLPLFALAATSCGGARVAVSLDAASVRAFEHAEVFGQPPTSPSQPPTRDALRLELSSSTELFESFRQQESQLQVRCRVEGGSTGRSYEAIGIGLRPHGRDDTAHRYVVYTFIDLEADDRRHEAGRPATTLDLRTASLDALSCRLVGARKWLGPFPRSNDLVVPMGTFHALLREADAHSSRSD